MLDLVLHDVLVELDRRDVETAVRNYPPAVDGIASRVMEGDVLWFDLYIRKGQRRGPAHGLERELSCPLQGIDKRSQLHPGGHPVKATDTHIHRVNGATSDQGHDCVAGLLELQAPLHQFAVIA